MKGFFARRYALLGSVFVLYTVLAIAMTAPLAFRLSDHLLGTDSNALNDTYFSIWIFGWQAHQLLADPLNLFQGNIFYPFPNALAFSEIILPGALLYLPLELASGNPVLAYNMIVLFSFPLNGFAMFLLAWDWMGGGERGATKDERRRTEDEGGNGEQRTESGERGWSEILSAVVAGVVFGFCTYKMGELRHVQLLLACFMPLTLMYVGRFLRVPNFHNGFLTALFFGLNALASLYYAVFLAFAVALYLVVELVGRRFRITRWHLIHGAIAVGIAVVLVLPFLLPFFRLEGQYNFSEGRDPRLFSARPASYLASPGAQWLYGALTRGFYVASKGQPLFPGLAALGLGVVGLLVTLRAKPRVWVFPLLLAVMGVVLSFGPDLIVDRSTNPALPFPLPYHYLALVVTPLKSLNAPSRFVVLTMLGLALLAAYGVRWLIEKKPRFGWAIAASCVVVMALEFAPVPLPLLPVATGATISQAYLFLAQQPSGQPIVELPMGKPTFAEQDKYVEYTYNSVYHWQPLVNGYSTFLPPEYYALVKDVQKFPARSAIKRLQQWGVQWMVVHADRYPNAEAVRAQLARMKGVEHVEDFGMIWLYRIGK